MELEHTPPRQAQNRMCRDYKPVFVRRCLLRSVSLWKTHSCPPALSAQPWTRHVTTRFIPHRCHANSYSEAVVPVCWRDVIFAHQRAAGRSELGSRSVGFCQATPPMRNTALKENSVSLPKFCCIYEHTCGVSLKSFFLLFGPECKVRVINIFVCDA